MKSTDERQDAATAGDTGMLVLSRFADESVILTLEDGRRISVKVVDVRQGRVKLGITADDTIEIMREELLAKGGR